LGRERKKEGGRKRKEDFLIKSKLGPGT